jgi:soluble lytic murein transglycosylase-like protein
MSIQKQMVEQLYSLADKAQQPNQIKALQQQITKSIQDGVVPAYAAIPLVQDLTGRLQKAITMQQMAGQPQAQGIDQPPIAEQVLAQAQGLDAMPSNLPAGEQAYAAGGIVAFAEGDLIDDDEVETEDDRQEASLMSLMAAAQNKIRAGLGRATAQFIPQSYDKTLAAQKAEPTTPTTPTEGGLSGLLSSAATKYGVPAALLNRVAGAESSGKADAANPRSSAKGVFQFTDKTWLGMGGKPGEQFNPEANVDLGAKYIRQNAEHLKKTLELCRAHHNSLHN